VVPRQGLRDVETEQLVARTLAALTDERDDWVSRRSLCVAVVSRYEVNPGAAGTAIRQFRVDGRVEQKVTASDPSRGDKQ